LRREQLVEYRGAANGPPPGLRVLAKQEVASTHQTSRRALKLPHVIVEVVQITMGTRDLIISAVAPRGAAVR
jgi:hypothetical protein